jgi:hypothetical protein
MTKVYSSGKDKNLDSHSIFEYAFNHARKYLKNVLDKSFEYSLENDKDADEDLYGLICLLKTVYTPAVFAWHFFTAPFHIKERESYVSRRQRNFIQSRQQRQVA